MHVIHFTEGATDPLEAFDSKRVRFLPLADAAGQTHLSCAHLAPGAAIDAPSLTHAAALLVVHGGIIITARAPFMRIRIQAGMGAVFDKDEPYTLTCETGAILLIVESDDLTAHPRGMSTPERISGATWPTDDVLAQNTNSESSYA